MVARYLNPESDCAISTSLGTPF